MTIETLELTADELSTYPINIAPIDEDDNAVTPNTMTWSVTTEGGTVIHGRDCVDFTEDNGLSEVGVLSTSMDIVLNGLDLQVLSSEDGVTVARRLNVSYTYDSDLGSDLPGTKEIKFLINNNAHKCSS